MKELWLSSKLMIVKVRSAIESQLINFKRGSYVE